MTFKQRSRTFDCIRSRFSRLRFFRTCWKLLHEDISAQCIWYHYPILDWLTLLIFLVVILIVLLSSVCDFVFPSGWSCCRRWDGATWMNGFWSQKGRRWSFECIWWRIVCCWFFRTCGKWAVFTLTFWCHRFWHYVSHMIDTRMLGCNYYNGVQDKKN